MKYGNMIDETNISYAFIIFYFILTKNYSIIKYCKRIKLLGIKKINVHLFKKNNNSYYFKITYLSTS